MKKSSLLIIKYYLWFILWSYWVLVWSYWVLVIGIARPVNPNYDYIEMIIVCFIFPIPFITGVISIIKGIDIKLEKLLSLETKIA